MALQQDSNGFLVGTVITDIKRSRKNSDALLIEVKKITDLLKKEGHLQAGNSDNASTNASANAGSQQRTRRQNQRNNSGGASNAGQSESSNSASSELSENSEQPAQQRRESLRQKRERQRRERQQQRLSQQEQQADSQQQQNPPQPDNNSDSEQSPGNTRQRDSRGRFTSEADNGSPEPITAGGDDATRGRHSRGRFSGGGAGGSGDRVDLEKDGDGNGGLGGLIGGLGDRIISAITAGQELQDVDPTIKAFQEVAEPLQRGYQFIFAGSSKKDKPYFAWFNKIWKSLKKTEDNTAEQGGESGFSIMGLITTFLTAGVAAWALFSKDGQGFWKSLKQNFIDPIISSIGNWLKESSGYNKAVDWTSQNVVEPVMPVIDSLIQGWTAIFTNMGTAWDLAVTAFSSGWEIASTAISEIFKVAAAAFSAIWTPIGGLIIEGWGAVVGFFNSNIFPIITAGWDRVCSIGATAFDYISKAFDTVIELGKSVFGFVGENWNKIIGFVSDIFTKFSNFMHDKFGIDIPAAAALVTGAVTDAGKSVADQAAAAKQGLADKISEMAQPVLDQAALAKQNITETVDKESKSVVDAADKNSQATEKTANAMVDYLKKLSDLGGKIGGGVVDGVSSAASAVGNAVIGTANASEVPYNGNASVGGNTAGAGEAKVSGSQADRMKMVYKAFRNADYSDAQAKAMTAEVGRENDYSDKYLFGSHIDPAKDKNGNNITNTGFFSWNRERRDGLIKHMESKGLWKDGKMVQSQAALDEQAKFARKEMESGKWNKGLGNFLENKNVDADTAAKQVGKGYIGWAYGQDTIKDGKGGRKPFNWRREDAKRARYQNKLEGLIGNGSDTAVASAKVEPQKTVIATPEQVKNAMPKTVQPVSAMPSIASISPIPATTTQSAKMPEMPGLVLPLSNNVKSSPTTIIPDVGQTVSDQHIAQIAYPYATSMGNNKS